MGPCLGAYLIYIDIWKSWKFSCQNLLEPWYLVYNISGPLQMAPLWPFSQVSDPGPCGPSCYYNTAIIMTPFAFFTLTPDTSVVFRQELEVGAGQQVLLCTRYCRVESPATDTYSPVAVNTFTPPAILTWSCPCTQGRRDVVKTRNNSFVELSCLCYTTNL